MTAKEEKKGKDAIGQIEFHEMTTKELTRKGNLQDVAAKFMEILKDTGCDDLCMRFPFPDPIADGEAGTAEASKERRRRHPRRKCSLREFIESMEDSKPK